MTVVVTVDVGPTDLPEYSCNSTIPKADPQTIITITIAAIGVVIPALAANDFRPVIPSNRLTICQESDNAYESSVHIDALFRPPTSLRVAPVSPIEIQEDSENSND